MNLHSDYPFWLIKEGARGQFSSLACGLTTDVLVIGGGITGALVGHRLIEQGIAGSRTWTYMTARHIPTPFQGASRRSRPNAPGTLGTSDRTTIRLPRPQLEIAMNMKKAMKCATAISLALVFSTSYAAGDTTSASEPSQPMTGKQKATAIGATTGAVAGAVVGGPVGAVVGAGIGGYVGHEGTDANGKVSSSASSSPTSGTYPADGTVRNAQMALNAQGYNAGSVDGQWGPNTQTAVKKFQAERGLTQTGTLDSATLSALGVSGS